jgi:hypothetical protein
MFVFQSMMKSLNLRKIVMMQDSNLHSITSIPFPAITFIGDFTYHFKELELCYINAENSPWYTCDEQPDFNNLRLIE